MDANYFFIDGSALTAQIRQLQRGQPKYRGRMLCPRYLVTHFMNSLFDLHQGTFKRATFYFPRGDETAIEQYMVLPDHRTPGEVRDISFKFCGHKLKKSAEFEKFVLETVPSKFHTRFSKSEKGIDIEMCCDALRLASAAKLERLFLFTNDGDFIPLCRTQKDFGANISILHLFRGIEANADLLCEADSYDVVEEAALNDIFLPLVNSTSPTDEVPNELAHDNGDKLSHMSALGLQVAAPETEKPVAAPSDMKIIDDDQAMATDTELG